jgi:glycosyltransferase involved in cell wall biosynthesis
MKIIKLILILLVGVQGFSDHIDINNPSVLEEIQKLAQKPIAILVTSYNNEQFARDNIASILLQEYSNYRVIFMNDCSTDATLSIVKDVVHEFHAEDKVLIIDNTERKLGLRNYYEAIVNLTKDEEIIVCVDGDDKLAHTHVCTILNTYYSMPHKEVWLTYGQFKNLNNGRWGWNQAIPDHIIQNNNFRGVTHSTTHLRTFYSWLFKRIKTSDLMYNGKFFEMTWDLAFMFPMLEMSKGRFIFIENLMYYYNDNNPISDHRVDVGLQRFYSEYIRGMRKYKPLGHNIFKKCNSNTCILCNENLRDEIYQ